MKKALALLIAVLLTFGAATTAFAQTVSNGIKYNVLVDGEKKEFSDEEALVVDGLSMFTADCYKSKFGCPSLTDESIAKANAFEYEGKTYYALREVAENCGLMVFWDNATKTALIVDKDTYEQVKALIEASNSKNADFKKAEIDMNGNIGFSIEMMGTEQSMMFPYEGAIKIDLDAPFMEFLFSLKSEDMPAEMKMYDDGEAMYVNSGEEESWQKMESSLAQSKEIIEQMKELDPAKNALAEDLSIAGLTLEETEEYFVIEGDMYVAETFNGLDMNAIMKEMYSQLEEAGVSMTLEYEWPDTMYVKYMFDKDGIIKEMYMKFSVGVVIAAEGETVTLNVDAEINVPRFIVDGDFEAVVPQEVLDNVVMQEVPDDVVTQEVPDDVVE